MNVYTECKVIPLNGLFGSVRKLLDKPEFRKRLKMQQSIPQSLSCMGSTPINVSTKTFKINPWAVCQEAHENQESVTDENTDGQA